MAEQDGLDERQREDYRLGGCGPRTRLLHDADVCVDPAPATDLTQHLTMIELMEYLALGKPVVA